MKTQTLIFVSLLPLAGCANLSVPCATTCMKNYIADTGCNSNDWSCLCNADYTLRSALSSCLARSCTLSEIEVFEADASEVCYGAQLSSIFASVTATGVQAGQTAVITVTEGGSTYTTAASLETLAASSSGGSSGGLSHGAIAGIVVGSVLGLAALIGLAFFFGSRRGKRAQPQAIPAEASEMKPAEAQTKPAPFTDSQAPTPANHVTPPPGYFTPSPLTTPGFVPVPVVGESKFVEADGTSGGPRYEMPLSEQTRPELTPEAAPNRHELGVQQPPVVYELGESR